MGIRKNFRFPSWLPVAASLALVAMAALMALTGGKKLNNVALWSRHSTRVIFAAQAFENNFLDIQRDMRGYIALGDTNDLSAFYRNVAREPQELNYLVALTADNPAQQRRLKALDRAVQAMVSYDYQTITLYRHNGYPGVSSLKATDEGRILFGRARNIMDEFSETEEKLWEVRDASEQSQYHLAERWLVAGSLLAALLLLFATSLASRELSSRRIAEARLKQTLLLQNAILACADYGIVATDSEGAVQTFNHAAERMLGYSAAEVLGQVTPMLWRDPAEIEARAKDLSAKLGQPVSPTFDVVVKQLESEMIEEGEWTFLRKDGSRFPCLLVITPLGNKKDDLNGFLGIFRDISERKRIETERESLIAELQTTLAEIKTLSGLIPICAWCKNVRSDTGYWQTVEQYVRCHSNASFSHGVCPSCAAKFKDDIFRANQNTQSIIPKA